MGAKVALVGIGGYGEGYAKQLLSAPAEKETKLVAGIDPLPIQCKLLPELITSKIPIYPDLASFFTQQDADLVVISSPIHFHAYQTLLALSHRANVLCEKPACAVIQDAIRMQQAEQRSSRFVAIGYQWSYTQAVQTLKKDIQAGVFGDPISLKTCIFWPRTASYYQRNQWAGRIKSDSGDWVLDSPANNALAHYLHNMLYVLGVERNTSARPVSVEAELYRVNPIENYDACAMRIITDKNIELLLYGAHSIPTEVHPIFEYKFELATITYAAYQGKGITATFTDGNTRVYGDPFDEDSGWAKLWQSIDAMRTGQPGDCGIGAATSHTLCVNGAQESSEINPLPSEYIQKKPSHQNDTLTYAPCIQEAFTLSYQRGCLPSEIGTYPWTRKGKNIDLRHYDTYPSIK